MSAGIFWVSVVLVAYTYAGYALCVAWLVRLRDEPLSQSTTTAPDVTVVVAAYNEAARIGQRVRNILSQDYPAHSLSIIVVSDGSDDGTECAAAVHDPRVRVLALAQHGGKAAALNAAMAAVETPFVVFTDARQTFARHAVRRLMAAFGDEGTGAVSGELEFVGAPGRAPVSGLYWRIEKALRASEAKLGWLHGVSGAVYALRSDLFVPLPPDLLLDDLWIPLHVVFAGRRVRMARDAVAYDEPSASIATEYRRKLRTLAGNWQLLAHLPCLLLPARNPVFFAWFSHKLLRLIAPWALLGAWFASAFAQGAIYQVAFVMQCAAYFTAVCALCAPRFAAKVPLASAAASFVMLNAAALLSLPACVALDARQLWKKT